MRMGPPPLHSTKVCCPAALCLQCFHQRCLRRESLQHVGRLEGKHASARAPTQASPQEAVRAECLAPLVRDEVVTCFDRVVPERPVRIHCAPLQRQVRLAQPLPVAGAARWWAPASRFTQRAGLRSSGHQLQSTGARTKQMGSAGNVCRVAPCSACLLLLRLTQAASRQSPPGRGTH